MDASGQVRTEVATLGPSDTFLRHSVALTLATAIVNGANWLYHVIMSRSLGPESYGVLTAIIGILIVFTVPANAIQMGVSAFVARSDASGEERALETLLRACLRGFLLLGVAASLALMLGSRWLSGVMRLDSPAPILVTAGVLIPWSVLPVLRGVLQGQRRPVALGLSMATESALKLATGVAFVALGYGVGGAIGGIVVGAIVALGATFLALRPRPGEGGGDAAPLAPLLRSLVPFALAIGCFTILTQTDVVLVKALFPPHQAGLYAAASTGAKIVLYLTGALPMVMVPRLVGPDATPGGGRPVLLRTARYAGLAGGALVVVYFIAPRQVIGLLFGRAYLDAAPLLGPLGVAMLAYEMALLGTYYLVGAGRLAVLPALLLPAMLFPIAVWGLGTKIQTVVAVIAATALLTLAVVSWSTIAGVADAAD